MKSRILAVLAAFGLGLGAHAATGHIFSITPCDQFGVNLTEAYTTYNAPVGAGKELYFKVTLATYNPNGEYWRLSYVGLGPEILEETYNPLQLGIFVSGRLQYASLVSFRKAQASQPQQSEMIFRYVTKPGDFAMPIVLAANYGADSTPVPVYADMSSASYYYLNPLNKNDWKITFNDSATPETTTNLIECVLQPGKVGDFKPRAGARPTLHSDSLMSAGFYVKTIDFSPDPETDEFWRTVHESSTITGGGVVPKLVIDAAPEVETTVYVWSDDETAVKIKGGVTRSIHTSAVDTSEFQVGTVTFKGGQVEAQDFQIEGAAGGENRTANLILSAYRDFNYSNATGDRIKDYITAKVKCIEPLPPSIVVECDRNTAVASPKYTDYAAVLQVYLSQPCEDPVEVKLTPSFTDGTAGDFKDYLRFSLSDTIDEPSLDGSDYVLPTVTIPAGSTGKQTIYLFCLRSDAHTIGTAKIKFSSSTTSTEIAAENCGSKSINVSAEITDITTPAEGSKIATTCNDEYPFTLAVDDTFADTHDVTTGYKIYIKYRASDTFKQLDGVYYIGDGNALYKLDMTDPSNPQKTQDLPILKYTASGEGLESQVYVVAPINPNTANAKKSVVRTFIADVKEARTVTITSFDEDFAAEKRSFDEGSDVGFRIKLSEKNETGAPIYAYIKPSANVSAEMFACQTYNCVIGMTDPAGLPINNSLDSNEAIVSLLDGKAKPGLKITFEVMLSTDPNWDGVDMSKKLGGYDSNYLTITTYNIEPTIKRIEMNGNKSQNDGYTFPNKLPMGQEQKFQIYVTEPGTFDLTSTENPFQVRWTATLDGQTYDDPTIIEGDPRKAANMFKYSFPAAGVWKITAEVKDKDMDDWSELDYSVYVTVLDQPALEGPEDVTLEENVLTGWKYTVGVGYYDPKYTGTLKVIVEVGEYSEGKANPGVFKLDAKYLMSAADAEAAIAAAAIPGFTYNANRDYYLVELNKSKLRQDLALEQLDGTDNSSIYGFTCVAHVINDDELPTSGSKAKAYYLESNTTRVWINNSLPVFGTVTMQNTNAWKVAGTTATSFPIRWQIKSDVKADWDGGITVEFTGCANAEDGKKVVYSPASGTFIPKFTETGDQTVTMTIYDKDGGVATWTYLYFVEPRKGLVVRPFGPASTTSSYYDNALGLGKGRVYADGTLDDITSFVQKWSYGVSTGQAELYAAGYKSKTDGDGNPVAYNDDGSLGYGSPKRDAAIGPSGEKYVSGPYYSYDGKYDNFFYRWLYITASTEGGAPTKSYDLVKIQTVSGAEAVSSKLPLDEYEKDKSSYLAREAEAIFSRENYVEDNLGDINCDGIPDLFMRVYMFDAFDATGELVGDDLADHYVDWDDGDYLPNARSIKTVVSVGVTNTWATRSENFDPVQELRGYNDELTGKISHFNDAYQIIAAGIGTGKAVALLNGVKADMRFTDPTTDERSTLSYAEWVAFSNYCTAKGWDPEDTSHWGLQNGSYADSWSPERPTNPNKEDTDGDGLSDGFEYYVWYQAHVGTVDADGNQVRLSGRRYNIVQPMFPDIITPEEIESLYDPLSKAKGVETRDTDNDGLTDLEEFVLGTSPIDFDTDGDGLPDGYEVTRSGTDPVGGLTDGTGNDDHDAMAYGVLEDWVVYPLVSDDGAVTNGFVCAATDLPIEEGKVSGLTDELPVYDAWAYSAKVFARGRLLKTDEVEGAAVGEKYDTKKFKVWAIHYDAYTEFGFDPRTGWKYDAQPYADLQKAAAYNPPLKTKPFTNLDESMVAAFYIHMDGFRPDDVKFDDENFSLNAFWAKWTTDPHNADTDGDGAPDGWELYDQRGPLDVLEENEEGVEEVVNHKIYYLTSPLVGTGADVDCFMGDLRAKGNPDGLSQAAEFSGIESAAEYAACDTIKLVAPEWRNKLWPTDQWDSDTDNDGITDADEGTAFLYGSSGTAGGGLNPHSWDTDADGLPDAWELQFAGTVATSNSVASATNSTASASNTVATVWNNDGMDGTVNDAMLDYDYDGLRNWQEYMVGAMRCWRFDDITSPWTVNDSTGYEGYSDDDWYEVLCNPESGRFNPGLSDFILDPGLYFSCANKAFDPVRGKFYMFCDGHYHDLRIDAGDDACNNMNRWVRNLYDPLFALIMQGAYPKQYICCDPCNADTDDDGMDDFFELFHGLDPMLGGEVDVVADAWGYPEYPLTATYNNWYEGMASALTRPDKDLRSKGLTDRDFFQYPWLAGLPDADPDGDNIRNQQEALFANVQAASTFLHVDPTPLWMTDGQYEDSLTYRYYHISSPNWGLIPKAWAPGKDYFEHDGVKYMWADFPWIEYDPAKGICSLNYSINSWEVLDYMYSFEENEGYDSDHDYLSDFEEAQGKTKSASDPQVSDSPLRRQAMWFGGEDDKGFLESPLPVEELVPDGGAAEARQNFLYYTVECWAKPDAGTYRKAGLQTLVERAIVTGPANPGDETYLRKNFLIGLNNGRWYTRFDSTGTDALQPVEIIDGPETSTNWTHVAASYDGKALKLYVNGELYVTKPTSIQPEHGVNAIHVNKASEFDGTLQLTFMGDRGMGVPQIAMLVGASAVTGVGVSFDYQWQTRNVLFYGLPRGINTQTFTTIADYGNFYKGYIDEVRVWDGARAASDISADYRNRTRYNSELALANRSKVFEAWKDGASRVPYADVKELPAQLMFHWAFDHVAGAVKAADVMQVPAGFSADDSVTDAKAPWSRPVGWTSFWLDVLQPSILSGVYTDRAWQPWVVDTVSHLPRFDGTAVDSIYWSENFSGNASAISLGYTKLSYPRNAEVPSRWTQMLYVDAGGLLYAVDSRWDIIDATGDEDLRDQYVFAHRNMLTVGSDLMIFGGAFPKRISSDEGGMWDEQGAADAWAETGADSNNDGLPDWWSKYALAKYYEGEPIPTVTWDTTVNYYGNEMTALEAYKRDLAKGMLSDTVYYDEYVDTRDVDRDGIPDWWEDLYGIEGGSYADAYADSDNDGLSNYVEYMLSEIFDLRKDGIRLVFDPTDPCSVDGRTSDYFYRLGDLYVGEIFADHDRMSDVWEHQYFDAVSPYLYDAGADVDGDGWSNYAEFQAGTDPTRLGAIGIDEVQLNEYPVPTVEISLDYEGPQNVVDQPIVIKAWRDPELETIPDAVWTIGASGDESVNTEGTTNVVNGMKYIGMNPNKEMMFHLSPGSIVKGSVKFEYKDTSWYLYDLTTGQSYIYGADSAIWSEVLIDREIAGDVTHGEIIDQFSDEAVGTIDYVTGAVVIDLTKVTEYMTIVGDITGQNTAAAGTQQYVSVYNLAQSYIRVKWNAKPIVGMTSATYYLSEADAPSANNNSLGHLKEGRNTFIAFYDLDGNGMYTAGEPYGAAYGVDVGWNYAKVSIAMTDTSVVSPRFNSQDCSSDRTLLYGTESGDTVPLTTGTVSGGKYERVRIVRSGINDIAVGQYNVPERVVLDKTIFIENEQLYITEADFLKDGSLDIDWETLADDLAKGNFGNTEIKHVCYRVVLGSGTIDHSATNNLLGILFRRQFDAKQVYLSNELTPVAIASGIVNSASPTFSWYIPNGYNTYTAFEINLYSGSTKIWNSGFQPMPARVRDFDRGWRYDWTAPIYVGDKLLNGKVFENNTNYRWEVRVTNARFRNIANWSDLAEFRMNVFTNSTDYGQIDVAVRHYGPAAIRTSGTIRVQAFETPDFTGTPAGQGYVYDLSALDSTESITEGNARIYGLPAGNYYLRAFVDSNNDGVCQDWETWGFTCVRDHVAGTIFTPRSVQVGPTVGHREVIPLYLEDSDTDTDNLPDAWEYAMSSDESLETYGVTALDQTLINGVAVKQSLSGKITASGKLPSGLSVMMMSALGNPFVAALACGVELPAEPTAESVTAALYAAVESTEIVENSVVITSLSLDTDNHSVLIGVVGELASSSALSPATGLYSFDLTTDNTVTCTVWRKETLLDADWKKVCVKTGIPLSLTESTITVDLGADIDLSSGFFKVTLEK